MAVNPMKVAVRGTTATLNTYAGPAGVIALDTVTGALVAQTGVAGGSRMALEKEAIKGLNVSGTTLTFTRCDGTTGSVTLPSSSGSGSGSGSSVTYTAGTGLVLNGTQFSHATAAVTAGAYGPTANATPAAGGTFTVPSFTVDAMGHVTAAANRTITLPAAATGGSTVSVTRDVTTGTKIATITVNGTANDLYAPAAQAGSTVSVTRELTTGTKIASITINGSSTDLYAPAASTNVASSSSAGLMSAADKSKLDGITAQATKVSVSSSLSSGTRIATLTINGTSTSLYAPAASEIDTSDFVDTSTNQDIYAVKTFNVDAGSGVVVKGNGPSVALLNSKAATSSTSATRDLEYVFAGSDYSSTVNDDKTLGGVHLYTTSGGNASILDYCAKPGSTSGRKGDYVGIQCGWWNSGSNASGVFTNSGVAGAFRPSQTNITSIGATGYLWTQVYANTSTISTSDERKKTDIVAIPDEVLDAWGEVGFYQYVFKAKKEVEGSAARRHFGVIAQRVRDTFARMGLDASLYSLYCYEKWEDAPEGDAYYPRKADEYFAIRYVEALCLEAAYQRRRADRMEERLAALEAKVGA